MFQLTHSRFPNHCLTSDPKMFLHHLIFIPSQTSLVISSRTFIAYHLSTLPYLTLPYVTSLPHNLTFPSSILIPFQLPSWLDLLSSNQPLVPSLPTTFLLYLTTVPFPPVFQSSTTATPNYAYPLTDLLSSKQPSSTLTVTFLSYLTCPYYTLPQYTWQPYLSPSVFHSSTTATSYHFPASLDRTLPCLASVSLSQSLEFLSNFPIFH